MACIPVISDGNEAAANVAYRPNEEQQWLLDLLEELQIECQVGDAAKIRVAEPRSRNMIGAMPG